MQSYRAALRARTPVRNIRSTNIPSVSRITSVRYATQDYGSGEGNPAGEKPQEQGTHKGSDLEHPGPPPPDVGQKGAGATTHKQDPGSTSNDNTSSSTSSSSNDTTSSDRSSKNGASPKLNTQPPDQSGDDVKEHNRKVDELKESRVAGGRGEAPEDEPVSKGFWKGHGGADSNREGIAGKHE